MTHQVRMHASGEALRLNNWKALRQQPRCSGREPVTIGELLVLACKGRCQLLAGALQAGWPLVEWPLSAYNSQAVRAAARRAVVTGDAGVHWDSS